MPPAEDHPPLDPGSLRMKLPIYRRHAYQGRSNDCAAYAAATCGNALLGEDFFDPHHLARILEQPMWGWWPLPHPVVRKVPGWAALPWGVTHELRRQGFWSRWYLFGTPDRLRFNLAKNRPTLVAVGEPWRWQGRRFAGWGHVKVLYAWDPGRGWAFVDSALPGDDSDSWRRVGIGWQSDVGFIRQWSQMLRFVAEVGTEEPD